MRKKGLKATHPPQAQKPDIGPLNQSCSSCSRITKQGATKALSDQVGKLRLRAISRLELGHRETTVTPEKLPGPGVHRAGPSSALPFPV